MKKSLGLKVATTAILLVYGLAAATIFTSCENFLKATETKRQIEDAIAYANAKECTLFVKSETDYGTFLSNGEKKCKVGYTTELQFTVNKDSYQFIELEAVSSKDNSQSRNDLVEFTLNKKESNESEGVYKYTVKLLKDASDILIRPVCIAFPKIIQFTPSADTAAYANTPITVTLNTPIEENQFRYANGYITITADDEDLTPLFEAPSLDETKTVVTLRPNGRDLYDYMTQAYINIEVSFGKNISVSKNHNDKTYTLFLKQDENSHFTLRYKNEIETVKPAKYEFFATTSDSYLDSNGNLTIPAEQNKFTQEDIAEKGSMSTDEYNAKILQNRMGETLYIYGRYYDADSGVNAVRITHKRTNSKYGAAVSENIITSPLYKNDSENAQFFKENGYTNFCIKYEIPVDESKEYLGDGAYLINVCVLDAAGNESLIESFTAIKDCFVSLSSVDLRNCVDDWVVSTLFAKSWEKSNYSSDLDFYEKELVPFTKHMCLYSFASNVEKYMDITSYREAKYKCPKDNVYIEYESRNGSTRQKIGWNEEKKVFETDLDVDSVSGLSVKLCVISESGYENIRIYKIPDTPQSFVSVNADGNYGYRLKSDAADMCYIEINNGNYRGKRGNISDCLNALFFAAKDSIVSDFIQANGTIPTTSNSNTFNSLSSINFDGNKCYLVFKNDVWNSYSSIVAVVNFYSKANGSNPIPITDTTTTGTETTFTSSDCLTKGNKKEISLIFKNRFNYTYDILQYCTKIQIILYGIDSSGKVQAKYDKTYNIKTGTSDTTAPVINSVTLLKPSQRIEKFGTDEEYIDNYLIVNATDSSMDSSNIYFSGLDYFNIYVDNVKTATVKAGDLKRLSHNEYALPLYGRKHEASLSYKIDVYDNTGKSSSKSGTINGMDDSCYVNWGLSSYSGGYYFNFNNQTLPSGYTLEERMIHAYKYENGKWNFVKTYEHANNMPLEAGYFYKFIPEILASKNSTPYWIFNPATLSYITYGESSLKNSGNYDLILRNGASTSSVAVSSDKPVFVQTIVTPKAYNICKDWDIDTWEANNPRHLGDTVIEFSPSDHGAKRYNIPVDQISDGECYVVIVHYADNSTQMSEVMQK